MANTPGSGQFGRKLATAAAVAATGFVCGGDIAAATCGHLSGRAGGRIVRFRLAW